MEGSYFARATAHKGRGRLPFPCLENDGLRNHSSRPANCKRFAKRCTARPSARGTRLRKKPVVAASKRNGRQPPSKASRYQHQGHQRGAAGNRAPLVA